MITASKAVTWNAMRPCGHKPWVVNQAAGVTASLCCRAGERRHGCGPVGASPLQEVADRLNARLSVPFWTAIWSACSPRWLSPWWGECR
jgi:hypothetical protein